MPETGSIPVISRQQTLPLSFNQASKLYLELSGDLHSLQREQPRVVLGLSFVGQLDTVALQDAVNAVVSRHEVLQTSLFPIARVGAFEIEGWRPVCEILSFGRNALNTTVEFRQRILSTNSVFTPVMKLESLAPPERDEGVKRAIEDIQQTGFDYESPPLLRTVLVRKRTAEHLLFVVLPELTSDRESLIVLQKEIVALYGTFSKKVPALLPALPIQYVDFAAWQRQRLQEHVLKKHFTYWEGQFKECDFLRIDELPFYRYTTVPACLKSQSETLVLDAHLVRELLVLANEQGTSLDALLLTGLAILLHYYIGKSNIGVGCFFANRTHSALRNLIGCFAECHLVAVNFSPELHVVELLKQVHATVTEARVHQELPSSLLLSNLAHKGILRRSQEPFRPRITFELQANRYHQSLPDLSIKRTETPQQIRVAGLTFSTTFTDGEAAITLVYRADRFEASDIQTMLLGLREVFARIITWPGTRISNFVSEFRRVMADQLLRQ